MYKLLLSATVCLALFGCMAHAQCREPNGTLPVSGSCDAYIECKNGVAEEKLCPDGLLYNEKSTGYPCSYPIDVECAQPQARLQPAQPTDDCPHQFGYYPMGDSKHCGKFMNCASGRGYVFDCPEGLAWNKETYKCDWPDQVPDCDAAAFLGFKCPPPPAALKGDFIGEPEEEYQFYPSSENCQVYFICIEGRPRRIACDEASAFNPETNTCEDIDNVPSCSAAVRQRGAEIKNAPFAASTCPEANGRFADNEQCDAYTECKDGVPEEKLCPDGLLFHQRTKTTGDCTYAPFTTCKERTRQQPANGTADCPRQFGFYSSGDPKKCGIYKNCAHGEVTITKCPEGLAFNVESYQCDWPDLVADCNAEAYLGFNCPPPDASDADERDVDVGPEGHLRYFSHPESCKKYIVCVNGHPRLYNCGKYLAFNPASKLCDFYTHVPECYARLRDVRKQVEVNTA